MSSQTNDFEEFELHLLWTPARKQWAAFFEDDFVEAGYGDTPYEAVQDVIGKHESWINDLEVVEDET